MVEYIDTERNVDLSIFYTFGYNPHTKYYENDFYDGLFRSFYKSIGNNFAVKHIAPLDTKEYKIYDGYRDFNYWFYYRYRQMRIIYDTYPYIIIDIDPQQREIINARLSTRLTSFDEHTQSAYLLDYSIPITVKQLLHVYEDNDSYYYLLKEVSNRESIKAYEITNDGSIQGYKRLYAYSDNGVLYIVRNLLGKQYDRYGGNLYGYNTSISFGLNDDLVNELNNGNQYLFNLQGFSYEKDLRIDSRHYSLIQFINDPQIAQNEILKIVPSNLYNYYNLDKYKFNVFENLAVPLEPLRRYSQDDILNAYYVYYLYTTESENPYYMNTANFSYDNVAGGVDVQEKHFWQWMNAVDPKGSFYHLRKYIQLEHKFKDIFNYGKLFDLQRNYIDAPFNPSVLGDIYSGLFDYCIMRGVYYLDLSQTILFNPDVKKDEYIRFSIVNTNPYVDVYFLPQTVIPVGKYFNFNTDTREKGLWKNRIEGYIHYNFPYIIERNYIDHANYPYFKFYSYTYFGLINFGFMLAVSPRWDKLPPYQRSITLDLKVTLEVDFDTLYTYNP